MLSVDFGLAQAFERFPWLYITVLETASVVYLLYLAWKIGTSSFVQMREGERRPMRFHEAIAFQWINPKARMMLLTAATTIHLHASLSLNAALMACVFVVIGLSCILVWAPFGMSLRRLLSRPRMLRAFNITMAVLADSLALSDRRAPLCPSSRGTAASAEQIIPHDFSAFFASLPCGRTGAYWSLAPACSLCSPPCRIGTVSSYR